MPNRRISHFELQELLGEGAMGRVYRAQDLNLDRPVALKLLGDRTLGDPSFLDRFKREARLAAQLNHPNIATIYAFGEDQGEAYIAMEFVEGDTLEARVKKGGPLPVAEVERYARQAAAALAVAHRRGIVHRDIKTANLMITADGDLKVMDFGVARRSGETQLTMAGSLIGTANIMAPELVKGGEATPAADLFSLGCVLYELLAGRPAFDAPDAMAILYQVIHDEPVPLAGLRPDAPPWLLQVVERLLIKDPKARLGPAEAVAEALSGEPGPADRPGTLIAGPGEGMTVVMSPQEGDTLRGTLAGMKPVPGAGPAAVRPFWKRRRVWIPASAVLVAVVSVIAAIVTTRGPAPDRPKAVGLYDQASEALTAFKRGTPPDSSLLRSARDLLQQATQADPTFAPAWNNLGELQRQLQDTPGADRSFKRAVAESSSYALAYSNLGMLYAGTGDTTKAETNLQKALDLDPNLGAAHLGLAGLLERTQKDQAEDHYRQAAQSSDPYERITADNNLGFLLVVLNRPEDAVALLEPAVSNGLNVPSLWKNLGLAYLQLGRPADADSAFTKAIRFQKGPYPQAEAGLAEASGDSVKARKLWGDLEAKNSDPDNPDADPDVVTLARQAIDRLTTP